jgi:glycosyltransferase involved in cell wall biosynthesis
VHVVHFSDTYLPRRDGVITSIRTLAHELPRFGWASSLVAPRHPDTPYDPVLPVEALPSMPCGVANLRLAAWPRSRHVEVIRGLAPDVVHVHTPGPVGLLGILAAHRLGLPLVQTYHTDLHAYLDAYRIPTRALRVGIAAYRRRLGAPRHGNVRRGPERRRGLMDLGNRLLLDGTDAVVLPTRAVLSRTALPVDPALVNVIPTGVAPLSASPAAVAAFRERWGLTAGDPTVVFVGRVNREKGVDLLVSAFAALLAVEPRARLVLVGAVYDRAWIEGLLAGFRDRVVRTGQLPPSEVAAAYGAADVFAFPSLTDTQGLVLQEAALADLPLVLVDSELHARGALAGAGLCTAPAADALAAGLLRVLREPAFAAGLARAGRERALAHTPDRYAAAMVDAYEAAVARRRGWLGAVAA